MKNYFEEIWDLHYQWGKGVLYNEIIQTNSVQIITSPIPGEYFNFAVPRGENPNDLDLDEIQKEFNKANNKLSFFIPEKKQGLGFEEYFVRNGFKLEASDCWVGYDASSYKDPQINSQIEIVTSQTFDKFNNMLSIIFNDFPGNDKYMEILKNILEGKLKLNSPGLKLELYLILDKGKPASGAGLFYSNEGNFAYLHDAGTLEEYRGKGYQSDLIKYRVNQALKKGINRIYSSVEFGSKSWSNCIKCGLNQLHNGYIFVKN